MIEITALSKRYGSLVALESISFEVAKGEAVGFLGPNGAGKTTALRILSTYLSPDSGTVRVAGFDVLTSPDEVRRRLGYLPERPPLYEDHTVEEYLRFCSGLRGIPRSGRSRAIASAVDRCGLGEVRGRLLGNLSKGFRQRVGLAQALIHDPEVLLLDEPTVGLDPHQIREIRELVRALARERTVLLSSHILSEVAMTCGRVVIVHRGRVVAEGPVAELSGEGGLETAFLRATSGEETGAEERGS